MSRGTGSIQTFQRAKSAPVPPPATVTGADDGLSLSGTSARLGQSIAAPGNPAQLLDAREIPLNGFLINEIGGRIQSLIDDGTGIYFIGDPLGNRFLQISLPNAYYSFGDDFGAGNGNELFIQDNNNVVRIATTIGANMFSSALDINGAPNDYFSFGDCGNNGNHYQLTIDDANQAFWLGKFQDNQNVIISDLALTSTELMYLDRAGAPRFQIGNAGFGGSTELSNSSFDATLQLNEMSAGGQSILGDNSVSNVYLAVDPVGLRTDFFGANGIRINNDTTLLHTAISLADGAGALVGTLNNAPAAGNPTKWIAIDDNGTTRHIPAW